jgi:hypothetical protein
LAWIEDSDPEPLDLPLVEFGQARQEFFPIGQQIYPHDTLVARPVVFPNQPPALGALYESYNCVVALLKEFRQLRDRGPPPPGEPGNAEKKLVLLRREAV